MSENLSYRTRVVYRQGEPLRYVGHLDMLRVWERALRRANLPLAYSQGFNPHPKITIAMPLPVGCTGEREELDIVLTQPLPDPEWIERLGPVLPTGLEIIEIAAVPLKAPARPSQIRRADYTALVDSIAADEVLRRTQALIAQTAWPIDFRGKQYDIRPLIETLNVQHEQGQTRIEMRLLRDTDGRLGRPDAVLAAIGLSQEAHSICRIAIEFEPAP